MIRLKKPSISPDARPSRSRRIRGGLWRLGAYGATGLMIGVLSLILMTVIKGAQPAWHWTVFTTPTEGLTGGLANAITGTLWLGGLTLVLVSAIGIAVATYAFVYGSPFMRNALLFLSDLLSGIPSIVFGYVGYLAFVVALGWGFSALAAALTLTMLALPYGIRSTLQALEKVPPEYWESALALGFPRYRVIWSILWPASRAGIANGAILALSVAMGETAPLLYTADWSETVPSWHLTHHPVAYLTYVVWTFIQQPYPTANALAYMAGLLLMMMVGTLSFITRLKSLR